MIPKIIHYCWFGNNPKSELINKCIKSWKEKCPDYKIIEWNESNFDINSNKYVKEAYENKKWAFVTDYVRLWVIYNYGGIYLDTDVELVKNLDSVIESKCFIATEDNTTINTGLGFGAEKNNIIVKTMLDEYSKISFIKANGKFDLTTCVIRNTKSIEMYLSKITNKDDVYISENFIYFPKEYFCPYDSITKELKITENTIGIHWFNASWVSKSKKIKDNFLIFVKKILGKENYEKLKMKFKK